MEKTKKNYIKGSAKTVTFPDGGELLNIDLLLSQIAQLPVTPGGYIKLTLSKRSTPDQYGNHYSMYENDYKPKEKAVGARANVPPAPASQPSISRPKTNDLPF